MRRIPIFVSLNLANVLWVKLHNHPVICLTLQDDFTLWWCFSADKKFVSFNFRCSTTFMSFIRIGGEHRIDVPCTSAFHCLNRQCREAGVMFRLFTRIGGSLYIPSTHTGVFTSIYFCTPIEAWDSLLYMNPCNVLPKVVSYCAELHSTF